MDREARTTLLINQVLAWHNRHPLARRITRAQITGVGTVALPFVGPAPGADGDPDSGPVSVLASSHAAQEAELSALEAELVAALGDAGSTAAPDAAADPADPAGAPQARQSAGARPARHPAAWWARWQALRQPKTGAVASPRRLAKPGVAGAPTWRVPVFSENFVPPLKPAVVARWAHRHAALDLPGAVDGPLREVPVDSGLRRLALRGRRAALQTRYLSSAAIEIDDSVRLRCLIGPFKPGENAAILGPRAWDPRRLAVAAVGVMLAASLAAGVAWSLRPAPAPDTAGLPPTAASAVPAAASEPAAAASAEAPSSASAPGGHEVVAPVPEPASLASGPAVAAASQASAPHSGSDAHTARAAPGAATSEPASAAGHAQTAASGAEAPGLAAPAASSPLGLVLSEETRREVKEASEAARAARVTQQAERQERRARAADPEHQPLPGLKPGKVVYALVAPPRTDKADAELELARIKSGASLMPYSSSLRFEVLPSDGQWRATWYPFVEKGSADRTRQMLLKRGVAVELVEF